MNQGGNLCSDWNSGGLLAVKNLLQHFLVDIDCTQHQEAPPEVRILYLFLGRDWFTLNFWGGPDGQNSLPERYRFPAEAMYREWLNVCGEFQDSGAPIIPRPTTLDARKIRQQFRSTSNPQQKQPSDSPGTGDQEHLSLMEYLLYLEDRIRTFNERRKRWHQSLRSFLEFLRSKMQLKCQGPLNRIFPEKMEFRRDHDFHMKDGKSEKVEVTRILRIPDKTALPIDVWTCSKIIQSLVDVILGDDRKDVQVSAVEALGMALLCLAVAPHRLLVQEAQIYRLEVSALSSDEGGRCVVKVPSQDGDSEVFIPDSLHSYLAAIPRREGRTKLFSRSLKSLRQVFDRAVSNTVDQAKFGKVTFLTFMREQHVARELRASYKRLQRGRRAPPLKM